MQIFACVSTNTDQMHANGNTLNKLSLEEIENDFRVAAIEAKLSRNCLQPVWQTGFCGLLHQGLI